MVSILTKRLLSLFQSQLQQQFLTMRRSWLRSGLLLRDDLVGQSSTTMSIIILIFVLCHMPRLGKQRNAVLTTRFHLIGVLCFPGKLANSQGFTSGTLGNTWNQCRMVRWETVYTREVTRCTSMKEGLQTNSDNSKIEFIKF